MTDASEATAAKAEARRRPWLALALVAAIALGGGIALDRYALPNGDGRPAAEPVSGCADAQRLLSDKLQESNNSTSNSARRTAIAVAIAVVEQQPNCFTPEDRANMQVIKSKDEDRRARCSSATETAERQLFC